VSVPEADKELDPLLDCLQIVAAHHGCNTTREALVAGQLLPESRLTPALFTRAASRAGLGSAVSRRPLE